MADNKEYTIDHISVRESKGNQNIEDDFRDYYFRVYSRNVFFGERSSLEHEMNDVKEEIQRISNRTINTIIVSDKGDYPCRTISEALESVIMENDNSRTTFIYVMPGTYRESINLYVYDDSGKPVSFPFDNINIIGLGKEDDVTVLGNSDMNAATITAWGNNFIKNITFASVANNTFPILNYDPYTENPIEDRQTLTVFENCRFKKLGGGEDGNPVPAIKARYFKQNRLCFNNCAIEMHDYLGSIAVGRCLEIQSSLLDLTGVPVRPSLELNNCTIQHKGEKAGNIGLYVVDAQTFYGNRPTEGDFVGQATSPLDLFIRNCTFLNKGSKDNYMVCIIGASESGISYYTACVNSNIYLSSDSKGNNIKYLNYDNYDYEAFGGDSGKKIDLTVLKSSIQQEVDQPGGSKIKYYTGVGHYDNFENYIWGTENNQVTTIINELVGGAENNIEGKAYIRDLDNDNFLIYDESSFFPGIAVRYRIPVLWKGFVQHVSGIENNYIDDTM